MALKLCMLKQGLCWSMRMCAYMRTRHVTVTLTVPRINSQHPGTPPVRAARLALHLLVSLHLLVQLLLQRADRCQVLLPPGNHASDQRLLRRRQLLACLQLLARRLPQHALLLLRQLCVQRSPVASLPRCACSTARRWARSGRQQQGSCSGLWLLCSTLLVRDLLLQQGL